MVSKVRGYFLVALILVLLLVGCRPGLATPSPTPLPTATMTPILTPTPLPTPTSTATPSPTATALPPPERPADLNDYPSVIVDYLTASQGDVEGMADFLTQWDALIDLRQADLDGDGADEIVLVIGDSTVPTPFAGRNLLVIGSHEGAYRLLFLMIREGEPWDWVYGVKVLEVSDLNADSAIDLAFTYEYCGAHTCFVTINLLTWDGLELISLLPEAVENAYGEYWFEDIDGDPALELLTHVGAISSVGAGPPRTRTDTYDWDGSFYRLVKSVYDESPFLFHKVVDADKAALDGEYEVAIKLYREAIDNPDLLVWKEWINNGETERADMHGYARYRLVVVYALLGERSKAQEALEEVEREQPDHVYAGVARAFWDGYTLDDDGAAGCAAATAYAAEHPAALEAFSDFGYGIYNPVYTLEDICPFGGG